MSDKKSPLGDLKRLRDEIRVKLDLASKETRNWWDSLEPQLNSVEEKLKEGGEKVADVSRAVGEELTSAFRRIRDRVGEGQGQGERAAGTEAQDGAAEGDGDSATDAEIVE